MATDSEAVTNTRFMRAQLDQILRFGIRRFSFAYLICSDPSTYMSAKLVLICAEPSSPATVNAVLDNNDPDQPTIVSILLRSCYAYYMVVRQGVMF